MDKGKQIFSAIMIAVFLSTLALGAEAAVKQAVHHKKKTTKQTSSKKSATEVKSYYEGIILVDADTGKVLSEDKADTPFQPASCIKLMDALIILEQLKQGKIKLEDQITVTAEACAMGGSGVYLKEKEVFTVDELLYALMVQSANDAAVALALHVSGTRDAFVALMNQRAKELRMTNTVFGSVHGLPPDKKKNQQPDTSTARDLSILATELCKYPDIFKYTATKRRPFMDVNHTRKEGQTILETHNHLLSTLEGCDGFKTGWYRVAGYSIIATAKRNDRRVIAVVGGCKGGGDLRSIRTFRDSKAKELISYGFANLPPLKAPEPVVIPTNTPPVPVEKSKTDYVRKKINIPLSGKIAAGLIAVVIISRFAISRSRKSQIK